MILFIIVSFDHSILHNEDSAQNIWLFKPESWNITEKILLVLSMFNELFGTLLLLGGGSLNILFLSL